MGSIAYFKKLTELILGRLCRQSGLLLAGLAALCAALPLLAGTAAESALSDGVSFSGVVLAVTGPEGDALPSQLERYMNGMEDISQYCRIEAMSRGAARTALDAGRVTAVLDFPDQFIKSVQLGENPPVKVVVDGARPLESLLTLWVGQSAADLLAAAQAGIYAVLDRYDAAPPPDLPRDRVVTEINLKYVLWTLNRREIFIQKRLLPTDALPIALHYELSLLAFLALSTAPIFSWICQRPWLYGLRRLRYAVRSPLWAYAAGLLSVWLIMIPFLFAAVKLLFSLPVSAALLTAVSWAGFFAVYASACALLTRTAAGCGGLGFFLSLGALALSGGIVPPVLLPDAVRSLGNASPITWMRALAASSLGYNTFPHPALALLLAAALLCALSALLYARRASQREGAP